MPLPGPVKAALRWSRRVLKALDRFANAIAGGDDRQTISYRAARARAAGSRGACLLCRFLDLFEARHCDLALDDAAKGAPLPR